MVRRLEDEARTDYSAWISRSNKPNAERLSTRRDTHTDERLDKRSRFIIQADCLGEPGDCFMRMCRSE